MHKYVLGFLLLFGFVAAGSASADTLGPVCNGCGGVVYTLTTGPDTYGLGAGWVDFTLKVDTTHIQAGGPYVLNAVALKDGTDSGTVLSVSAGTWSMVTGGINNGGTSGAGCVMNTSNHWVCSQSTAPSTGTGTSNGVATGAGDIYTFVFGFLLPTNSTGDLASGVGLKAYYDNTSNGFGGLLTSDTFMPATAPVPEPGTLTLLAAGLIATVLILKRR